jgi:Uma2 family endonuclease
MAAAAEPTMTYAEYLATEARAEVRHEWLRGRVFAMAGGTIEHGRLAANMTVALSQALRGRPCVVLSSDVRVRIDETDRTTYPDLSVVCGPRLAAATDRDAITNPIALVEVLSDSTEADDRGEKFAHYRRLPSLRAYVLVSQRTPRIEVYGRETEQAPWTLAEAGPGGRVHVVGLDIDLSADEVYFDPAAPR